MATWFGGRERLTRARYSSYSVRVGGGTGAATAGRLRDLDALGTGLLTTLNPVPVLVDVASIYVVIILILLLLLSSSTPPAPRTFVYLVPT